MMEYVTTPGVQGICPTGWHVPTHDEWTDLERALCTSGTCETDFPYDYTTQGWSGTDEGGKLKEAGTSHWSSPNTGATNTSGFTCLPGGYRHSSGSFTSINSAANLWTSYIGTQYSWRRAFSNDDAQVYRGGFVKSYGFSVRCLKN